MSAFLCRFCARLVGAAGFEPATEGARMGAHEENAELRAEIERLRALVHGAYNEGFSEGMRENTSSRGGKPWRESSACKALAVEQSDKAT